MTHILDIRTALRDQSASLIRAEVLAGKERKLLDKAVRDAILKMGATPDEVSAETGYTLDDIARVLAEAPALDDGDLMALAGLR